MKKQMGVCFLPHPNISWESSCTLYINIISVAFEAFKLLYIVCCLIFWMTNFIVSCLGLFQKAGKSIKETITKLKCNELNLNVNWLQNLNKVAVWSSWRKRIVFAYVAVRWAVASPSLDLKCRFKLHYLYPIQQLSPALFLPPAFPTPGKVQSLWI